MQLIASDLYRIVDPKKKDAKYINNVLTNLRQNWRPLVDQVRMAENKRIIFGEQDMSKIKAMFKDKEFLKCTEFIPLGIWTRIVNVIVEEITKIPPKVELKANDATAISDKQQDILLLQSMGKHAALINSLKQKVGDKIPFTVPNDKFKTNIEEFQRLGLDANDPEDIEFYKRGDYPKLKAEIAGQKLINILMKINRFDEELIRDCVYDLLAALCICLQTYVDAMTGEIRCEHIYPEQAYGIFSDERDGSNDICQGWTKNMTVREWLGRVGNEFDFEKNWTQLLWALNYTNGTRFTGFIRNGINYDMGLTPELGAAAGLSNGVQQNALDWNLAYTYKIYIGYMEFSSIDASATYLAKIGTGDIIPQPIDFDYFMSKEQMEEYYKESYYNEQKYKSYFLVTSSTSQWIYDWGKVYYQQLEGSNDQYSRGTLIYYRLEGVSAADISKFYIELANLTAYRLKWMVYHSKPRKEQYILPELIKISKAFQKMYPQNANNKSTIGPQQILEQIIQFKRENFVDIRDFPEVDGKPYPNIIPQDAPTPGTDPMAIWMQAIEAWCEQQIAEKIGLNDIRMGQVQNARQGVKQGEQTTEASYNSTGYLFRSIQYVKERVATTSLLYAQDIIKFKDSLPYNYILKLLGVNEFENLKILQDFATHRFGLVFQGVDDNMGKQMLMKSTAEAMERGQITPVEFGLLYAEEDYRKGLSTLNAFRYLSDKKARKIALQDKKIDQDNKIALEKQEEQTEKTKGDIVIQKEKIAADAMKYVADANAKSKIDVKQITVDNEPGKQAARVQGQKELVDKKADTEQQKAFGQ